MLEQTLLARIDCLLRTNYLIIDKLITHANQLVFVFIPVVLEHHITGLTAHRPLFVMDKLSVSI